MNVTVFQPVESLLIFKLNLPIVKTLNGSIAGGNTGCMLRSQNVTVNYKKNTKWQEKIVKTYIIKGLRGAVRHAVMEECKAKGIEVCHTTNKEEDKSQNKLLVDGFHLLGSCINKKECIIHQIFGSMRQESIISVSSDPIIFIDDKFSTFKFSENLQVVHIATEKRICKNCGREFELNSITNPLVKKIYSIEIKELCSFKCKIDYWAIVLLLITPIILLFSMLSSLFDARNILANSYLSLAGFGLFVFSLIFLVLGIIGLFINVDKLPNVKKESTTEKIMNSFRNA